MKDRKGNRIRTKKIKSGYSYTLVLKNWDTRRMWTMKGKTFYIRRKEEKHLFNKTNSYWFNDYLLRNAFDEDQKIILHVTDTKQKYLLRPRYIQEVGHHLNFSSVWLELQVFVSLKDLEKNNMEDITDVDEFIQNHDCWVEDSSEPVEETEEIDWKKLAREV